MILVYTSISTYWLVRAALILLQSRACSEEDAHQPVTKKSKMIPKVMKALIKEEETTSYYYKEVPVPSPQEGDLLVKVKKVALCGSDISLYQWNEGTVNTER